MHPPGPVGLQVGVALGEGAEWPVSSDPGGGPGCPGPALSQQPPGADNPLAGGYLPLAWLAAAVADAAAVAESRLTALTAVFQICAPQVAQYVCAGRLVCPT